MELSAAAVRSEQTQWKRCDCSKASCFAPCAVAACTRWQRRNRRSWHMARRRRIGSF